MNTPNNKLEIVIPKFRWDAMQRDLEAQRFVVAKLNEEKRRLCEVVALLVMASGNKIEVGPDTIEKFHGKLELQIMSTDQGGYVYEVRDPLQRTGDAA